MGECGLKSGGESCAEGTDNHLKGGENFTSSEEVQDTIVP